MSIRMRYIDSDKLEVVLNNVVQSCASAGVEAEKECAKAVKKAVIKRLEQIKTENPQRIKHMCEDVQIVTKKDEFGEIYVKVQGGKTTGTLWHIVNDGTYRTEATHFMDLALNEVESELENIINKANEKEGL